MTTKPLQFVLAIGTLLWSAQANAYCFLMPDAITYGRTTNGQAAGTAFGIRTNNPLVEDMLNGKAIVSNMYIIVQQDITLTLEDASKVNLSLFNGEAIALNATADGYFIFHMEPLSSTDTVNPDTDLFARGNWPEDYPGLKVIQVNGQDGAYIRVSKIRTVPLGQKVTGVAFGKMVEARYKNNDKAQGYANHECTNAYSSSNCVITHARPIDIDRTASHTPFTTQIFKYHPVTCEELGTCPPPDTKPVNVEWSLLRTD